MGQGQRRLSSHESYTSQIQLQLSIFPQNMFDSSYTEMQANTGDSILERSVDQHSGVLQSVRGGVVGVETGIPMLVRSGGRTERNLFWRRVWKFGTLHKKGSRADTLKELWTRVSSRSMTTQIFPWSWLLTSGSRLHSAWGTRTQKDWFSQPCYDTGTYAHTHTRHWIKKQHGSKTAQQQMSRAEGEEAHKVR